MYVLDIYLTEKKTPMLPSDHARTPNAITYLDSNFSTCSEELNLKSRTK